MRMEKGVQKKKALEDSIRSEARRAEDHVPRARLGWLRRPLYGPVRGPFKGLQGSFHRGFRDPLNP